MKKMTVIVLIIAAIILTFILADGSFLQKKYYSVYEEKYVTSKDDLSKIIGYAIGAPSGHNMQPWLVKIVDDNSIELYADMSKQLTVVDSTNNQLLMSQGTFIERFKQGANAYGYNTRVEYSEVDLSQSREMIAKLFIEKIESIDVDTVTHSTAAANNSAAHVDMDKAIAEAIQEYEGFTYEYINAGKRFGNLQDMLLQGTIVESKNIPATEELLNVFRWTEWDKNKHRYGLSLNSMPNLLKPFIQPIMSVTSKNAEAFGNSSIKMFEDRLSSEIGYILIKHKDATNNEFIAAGEIYQKLILSAEGYSLRPAVQLLEQFDDMLDLNKKFQNEYGDGEEVVLILCVQQNSGTKAVSNPRHMVEDIIIE